VEEMFLLKTVDAEIKPKEEGARRWEMRGDPEHFGVDGPSRSASGRTPRYSLFGGEGSGQHPAKTDHLVNVQKWPTPRLYSPYFSAIDGLTPKSTFSTLKPGF
jgi:hypothetical protein